MQFLDDESLLNIVQYLGLQERLRFAQVSSRFNRIVSFSKLFWRDVALTITDTKLFLRVGKSPLSQISNIDGYSRRYGQWADSLDLTIDLPFGFDACINRRIQQIVNSLDVVSLQTLTLRFTDFGDMYNFGTFFKTIKSSLKKVNIICRFPNVSLYFVKEICKTKPTELREISWMHEQNYIMPPTIWLASLMLVGIAQDSKKICFIREEFHDLCDELKKCEKLLVFQTNILVECLCRTLSTETNPSGLNVVLVVNEHSMLNESESDAVSVEACHERGVVLHVTSLEANVICTLRNLPASLSIKKLRLTVVNVQNILCLSSAVRVVADKFTRSLRSIYVDINKGEGAVETEAVKWIRLTYPKLTVSA